MKLRVETNYDDPEFKIPEELTNKGWKPVVLDFSIIPDGEKRYNKLGCLSGSVNATIKIILS